MIIQNNIVGIGLANSGAQALIQHNLIQNNNQPGAATGTGYTKVTRPPEALFDPSKWKTAKHWMTP